jgi:hypothetical protein
MWRRPLEGYQIGESRRLLSAPVGERLSSTQRLRGVGFVAPGRPGAEIAQRCSPAAAFLYEAE